MLENSLPTNFVGKDGFYWWIGQVEKHDVKNSNRFKVRIVGHHLRDCNAVAVDDLPWAITMLPVTTPYRTGNSQGASANLRLGDWVVGFFMDGADGQQPVIMGSVGATANATKEKPVTDPNPGGCKAFTTYLPNDHVPPLDEPNKKASDKNKNLAGTHTAHGSNEIASEALLARCGERSAANPFGTKFCVPLNDGGKCDDAPSNFERILNELMLAVQDSGGQLGSYLINKYTGGLYSYVDQAQGAINKIFSICKSLLARLKGELIKLVRQGVDALLKSILTPKSGGLKKIVDYLKQQLDKIGCTIDGLLERLLQFLTDLIMGYVLNIINAAFCQVENFLNTLTSQLQSLMNEAVSSVLGSLQSILDSIAAPLDIVGQAMSFIMDLLGISCTGLSGCNKEKESCTDGTKKKDSNLLDDLLAAIEDGELAGPSYCSDALENPLPVETAVEFLGGTPAPSPTTGVTPTPSGGTTPAPAPTYTIAPNVYSVSEGGSVVYTISTTQITDGTVLHYYFEMNNAPTVTTQISGPTLSSTGAGTVTISSNTATITVNIVDDSAPEEDDILRINLENVSRDYIAATAEVTVLASDAAAVISPPVDVIIDSTLVINIENSSAATPVIFTPITPPGVSSWAVVTNDGNGLEINFGGSSDISPSIYVAPASIIETYKLTADKTTVGEGETITFTVTTTNVPDNTILNYTIFGPDITPSDFYINSTIGTVKIIGNVGVLPLLIAEDTNLEGLENCTLALDGKGVSIEFWIKADPPKNILDTIIPAFVPPVACPAQVDSSGKILSIDICNVGDPYLDPPTVIVSGSGFGAAAVAELDNEGYVSKVNILRPGLGYQENDNGNRCILTNIIPLQVGFNFSSEPTVYIDGDSSIAKAKINDNGQVIGYVIVDKTKVFKSYPKVEIFGDGTGATAIAKIDCYPDDTIRDIKLDVSGGKQTGSYVDCP